MIVTFGWEHIFSDTRGPEALTVVYDRDAERVVSATLDSVGAVLVDSDLDDVNESIAQNIAQYEGDEDGFFEEYKGRAAD